MSFYWFIFVIFGTSSASINFGAGEDGKLKCREFQRENNAHLVIKSNCFEAKEVKLKDRG